MLLKDLDFEGAFKYIDEATGADWKGKDLKQAKHIPNIDILLLAVRKVIMEFSRVNNSFTQWQKIQAKCLKFFLTACAQKSARTWHIKTKTNIFSRSGKNEIFDTFPTVPGVQTSFRQWFSKKSLNFTKSEKKNRESLFTF